MCRLVGWLVGWLVVGCFVVLLPCKCCPATSPPIPAPVRRRAPAQPARLRPLPLPPSPTPPPAHLPLRVELPEDAHVPAEVGVAEVYQLAVLAHHAPALGHQQRHDLAVVAADRVLRPFARRWHSRRRARARGARGRGGFAWRWYSRGTHTCTSRLCAHCCGRAHAWGLVRRGQPKASTGAARSGRQTKLLKRHPPHLQRRALEAVNGVDLHAAVVDQPLGDRVAAL